MYSSYNDRERVIGVSSNRGQAKMSSSIGMAGEKRERVDHRVDVVVERPTASCYLQSPETIAARVDSSRSSRMSSKPIQKHATPREKLAKFSTQ
jgi:hypothetical protein